MNYFLTLTFVWLFYWNLLGFHCIFILIFFPFCCQPKDSPEIFAVGLCLSLMSLVCAIQILQTITFVLLIYFHIFITHMLLLLMHRVTKSVIHSLV